MSDETKDYLVIYRVGIHVKAKDDEEAREKASNVSLNDNAYCELDEIKEDVL
jgi:hypothetical protein